MTAGVRSPAGVPATAVVHPEVVVHPTAVVDAGAIVGGGTTIWHFCHVMAGARIGAHASLGQNVFVGSRAVIGDGCRIQNNVSVYDAVTLEDEVFIGPGVVFTNVKTPRAFVSRKDAFQPTRVGRGASIGANATIVCGVTLGPYSLVGAGAVVTRDVPPHALVAGVPARRRGWVCRCGVTLPAPAPPPGLQAARSGALVRGTRMTCPACGESLLLP